MSNELNLLSVVAKRIADLQRRFTTLSKQAGPVGADGKAGERGPAGPRGVPGRDGKDGTDGRDGTDGLPGVDGKDGRDGADGAQGETGSEGPMGAQPKHEWDGTKLRFQQTAKRWGKWVDLRGASGGTRVLGAGGSDFDPSSLPMAADSPTPDEVIVKQDGVWVRATWDQFSTWIGSVGPATGTTVNGEAVTVNGETVFVNGS